jgi:hypothetical protein
MGNTRAKPIDSELVKSMFAYIDGGLVWAINKGRAKAGDGPHRNSNGYNVFKIDGVPYLEHRLIWAWHNMPFSQLLDHINGNILDNRVENLRAATHSENMRNSRKAVNNTSGVKGVYWQKDKNMWRVQIWNNGKQQYVGRYRNIDDAQAAAASFRQVNHLEFANEGI